MYHAQTKSMAPAIIRIAVNMVQKRAAAVLAMAITSVDAEVNDGPHLSLG